MFRLIGLASTRSISSPYTPRATSTPAECSRSRNATQPRENPSSHARMPTAAAVTARTTPGRRRDTESESSCISLIIAMALSPMYLGKAAEVAEPARMQIFHSLAFSRGQHSTVYRQAIEWLALTPRSLASWSARPAACHAGVLSLWPLCSRIRTHGSACARRNRACRTGSAIGGTP